jgi:hypothetical protein
LFAAIFASRLDARGSESLRVFGKNGARGVPASPLRFLSLPRTTCERGGLRFRAGRVRNPSGEVVGEAEGFLVNPSGRTVAAVVVRWLRHPERCLCLLRLATVAARVDLFDGILNVEIAASSDDQPGDAFDAEHYPAFSDDDLVAALFGGVARD